MGAIDLAGLSDTRRAYSAYCRALSWHLRPPGEDHSVEGRPRVWRPEAIDRLLREAIGSISALRRASLLLGGGMPSEARRAMASRAMNGLDTYSLRADTRSAEKEINAALMRKSDPGCSPLGLINQIRALRKKFSRVLVGVQTRGPDDRDVFDDRLVCLTDEITLKNNGKEYQLGRFWIVFRAGRETLDGRGDGVLLVYREHHSVEVSKSGYIHPHVFANNEVCLGTEMEHYAGQWLASKNYFGVMTAIDLMLHSFHSTEIYRNLAVWNALSRECVECLGLFEPDEMVTCQGSGVRLCRGCAVGTDDGVGPVHPVFAIRHGGRLRWYSALVRDAAGKVYAQDELVGGLIPKDQAVACSFTGRMGREVGSAADIPTAVARNSIDIFRLDDGRLASAEAIVNGMVPGFVGVLRQAYDGRQVNGTANPLYSPTPTTRPLQTFTRYPRPTLPVRRKP